MSVRRDTDNIIDVLILIKFALTHNIDYTLHPYFLLIMGTEENLMYVVSIS